MLEDCVKALSSLSQKSLIHWDLKPDNLMLNILTKDFVYNEDCLIDKKFFEKVLSGNL